MHHFWDDFKKRWIAILAIAICASMLAQVSSYAAEREVSIDNHTNSQASGKTVSGITIAGLTRPRAGESLDQRADVTTVENAKWEIPVLWVDNEHNICVNAVEGNTYLPVLMYSVPDEYEIEGATYTITLSDDLTELFGTEEVISYYNVSTGTTYILPASLRDLFAGREEREEKKDNRIDPDVGPGLDPKRYQNLENDIKLLKDKVAVLEAKNLQVAKVRAKARKGRKALITWKKNKQATGYQIRYSTSRNFKKSVKNVTVRKASVRKKWLKRLRTGKTYYVKVRTVKTFTSAVTGKRKTVYGKWSATRRFRVKR